MTLWVSKLMASNNNPITSKDIMPLSTTSHLVINMLTNITAITSTNNRNKVSSRCQEWIRTIFRVFTHALTDPCCQIPQRWPHFITTIRLRRAVITIMPVTCINFFQVNLKWILTLTPIIILFQLIQ